MSHTKPQVIHNGKTSATALFYTQDILDYQSNRRLFWHSGLPPLMLSMTSLTHLAVRGLWLQRIKRFCVSNRPNRGLKAPLRAILMCICAPSFCFGSHELERCRLAVQSNQTWLVSVHCMTRKTQTMLMLLYFASPNFSENCLTGAQKIRTKSYPKPVDTLSPRL